jgi:hypothetical protein
MAPLEQIQNDVKNYNYGILSYLHEISFRQSIMSIW